MSRTNTGDNLASRTERQDAGRLVGWRCPVCDRRINMTGCKVSQLQMDHLHASANGGSDAPGNLIPMCGQCNATKNAHETVDGLARAIVKAGHVKTIAGARRRIQRIDLVRELEWLAVAVGAMLEEGRK